jgi:hypothetical protein
MGRSTPQTCSDTSLLRSIRHQGIPEVYEPPAAPVAGRAGDTVQIMYLADYNYDSVIVSAT